MNKTDSSHYLGKLFRLNRCNTIGLSSRSSALFFPFSVGEYSCVADDF